MKNLKTVSLARNDRPRRSRRSARLPHAAVFVSHAAPRGAAATEPKHKGTLCTVQSFASLKRGLERARSHRSRPATHGRAMPRRRRGSCLYSAVLMGDGLATAGASSTPWRSRNVGGGLFRGLPTFLARQPGREARGAPSVQLSVSVPRALVCAISAHIPGLDGRAAPRVQLAPRSTCAAGVLRRHC